MHPKHPIKIIKLKNIIIIFPVLKRGIKNNEIEFNPGIITSNQQNNPKITKKNLRKFGPGNPSHLSKKSLLILAIIDTA